MHFHFDFGARQVLWTLTFAAQMVLLVVLMGRDRMRRYPWFTTATVLSALHLMVEVMLVGRMAMLPLQEILITMDDLAVIVGLLVVVEVARRAFAEAKRSLWIVNATGLLVAAGLVLAFWGPWLTKKDLVWDTIIARLHLMQFAAQKGNLLVAILTIGLGLLVVIFGRHFKAGWRSHTQMIAIGISTMGISSVAMQVIFGRLQATVIQIIRTAQPNARQEYEHLVSLATKLGNANKVVYIAALLWWIVWLWLDEPGTAPVAAIEEKP
ncbi:MAG: hypothetical protein WCD70_11310 [Alphaproteobacteria bacterium]